MKVHSYLDYCAWKVKAPLKMRFCMVSMPFPRRRILSIGGTPSVATVTNTDHSAEWKIITSSRGAGGKSTEAMFPGTVKFAPCHTQRLTSFGSGHWAIADDDSDVEKDTTSNMANVEDFLMEKMNKDRQAVDPEERFCWPPYNYAKVSIFPAVKTPVECSTQNGDQILERKRSSIFMPKLCFFSHSFWCFVSRQIVTSGDYILWNTLGNRPITALPKN